jgi:RNA polymerase sigma-70 factor (ECF subfamily)
LAQHSRKSSDEAVSPAPDQAGHPDVNQIYRRHGAFVWRNLRRLGIPENMVEDVLQDVFMVVHRRLLEFESRSSLKTWLFGIVLRVVRTHRRSQQRRRVLLDDLATAAEVESDAANTEDDPAEIIAHRQASRLLHRLLDELDDDKRALLVSVDLEEMTIAEAAEAMNVNANTAYSRLKIARQEFQGAVMRHLATERRAVR